MARPNVHEIGWAMAELIERQEAHWPHPMRSCQSYGPIKAWCCDFHRTIAYTIDLIPPICQGGSFRSDAA